MSFRGLPLLLQELLAKHLCPLQPTVFQSPVSAPSYTLHSSQNPLSALPLPPTWSRSLPPHLGIGSASRPTPAPHFMKSQLRVLIPLPEAHPHVLCTFSHTMCLKEREGAPWSNKFGKPRVTQSLTGFPFLQALQSL